MTWYTDTEPTGVPRLSSFNLDDYPTTGTRIPRPRLYGYLHFHRVYAQIILWPSKQGRP